MTNAIAKLPKHITLELTFDRADSLVRILDDYAVAEYSAHDAPGIYARTTAILLSEKIKTETEITKRVNAALTKILNGGAK